MDDLLGFILFCLSITVAILILAITFFVVVAGIGIGCYLGAEGWCGVGPTATGR